MPIVKTDVYDVQAPFALDLRLVKADMNARNAIGTFQRYVGMTVFVLSENTWWQLQGGTTNDDWVEVDGGANFVIQSVVVNAAAPSGGNDGDIWFRQVGSTVTVYQRVSGAWTALGAIVVGTSTPSSVLTVSASPTLDWAADEAPDGNGDPSGQTYAQRFGNTPQIQVWLETSTDNYSLETVPITIEFSGTDIETVSIDTSNIAARIIIK